MVRRNVHASVIVAALLMFVVACSQDHPTAATSCDQFGVGCTPEEVQSQFTSISDRLAAARAGGPEETYLDIVNPALVQCQLTSYRGKAKVIGPGGGVVSFGPHKITIPPGALGNYLVVYGELHVANHVVVELSPHGLQMSAPAILELAYGTCQSGNGFEVAYVDDNLNIISYPAVPPGGTNSGEVRAELWHFSQYAVAY